jgi:prepilin-type N-terminal cleavage/methylation domain-containing protein
MRRGFTLIELLVVIAIIAILMSFSIGAIYVSQESARAEKTRGLIGKIDQIIAEKYESYRYRRVPISMTATERTSTTGSKDFAKRRLQALRELMRMEMPDRWTDVSDNPAFLSMTQIPAVTKAYRRHNTGVSDQYQGAECLYLILALSGDDRASIIVERNKGDLDGDGAPEILDGWGLPISFIRWPAGFLNNATNGYVTDLQDDTAVAAEDHDPFDHRKVHTGAYAMYPLIYSAGPDRITDIRSDNAHCDEQGGTISSKLSYSTSFGSSPNNFNNNPLNNTAGLIGEPYDWGGDGDLQHHDNIHNHLLGVK